jgi:hypothetical protein
VLKIDWTINVGDLLALLALALGAWRAQARTANRLSDRLGAIETKLELMYNWFTRKVILGGGKED